VSTVVDVMSLDAKLVAVIADPGESAADLLVELQALGFVTQRVSPATIGALSSGPAVALVVGAGTRAMAQARRVCMEMGAHERLAEVPIVVVLPAGRVPIADPTLDAHELIMRPLRPGELLSRIGRARGRAPTRPAVDLCVRAGDLRLDPWSRVVWIGDGRVPFSAREFELLHHLTRHPSRVHTRQQLLQAVWRGEAGVGMRAVDVQVRRVRAKLGDDLCRCIRTVRNVGYAFDERLARRARLD